MIDMVCLLQDYDSNDVSNSVHPFPCHPAHDNFSTTLHLAVQGELSASATNKQTVKALDAAEREAYQLAIQRTKELQEENAALRSQLVNVPKVACIITFG